MSNSIIDNQRDWQDFVPVVNTAKANVFINGKHVGTVNKNNIIGYFDRKENDYKPDQGAGKLLK